MIQLIFIFHPRSILVPDHPGFVILVVDDYTLSYHVPLSLILIRSIVIRSTAFLIIWNYAMLVHPPVTRKGKSTKRTIWRVHTGSISALTSAKMRHCFWSRPHFWEGLGYLQFEFKKILSLAFWEKSKKPPKIGFLGPFWAKMLKLWAVWLSFLSNKHFLT